jgi:hypothetical protein
LYCIRSTRTPSLCIATAFVSLFWYRTIASACLATITVERTGSGLDLSPSSWEDRGGGSAGGGDERHQEVTAVGRVQRFAGSSLPRQLCGPRFCLPNLRRANNNSSNNNSSRAFDYFPAEGFEHIFLHPLLNRIDLMDRRYWNLDNNSKSINNNNNNNSATMEEREDEPVQEEERDEEKKEGLLWKRRDVFKNKWRPRWFVLQKEEAVLTYYLLSRTDAGGASTISTPLRKRSSNVTASATTASTTISRTATANNTTIPVPSNSLHSTVSELTTDPLVGVPENPVDFDVVPRGAIYLAGCRVSANDSLSIPEEGLFAFTIVPPLANESECHLAARTEEARSAWVASLTAACDTQQAELNGTRSNDGGSTPTRRNGDSALQIQSSAHWKSLSPIETLFDNVPAPLAATIEQTLEVSNRCIEMTSPFMTLHSQGLILVHFIRHIWSFAKT